MAYNPSVERGNAEYRSWLQLPETISLTEGGDIPLQDKKYAQLVYLVGSDIAVSTPVSSIINNSSPALAQYIEVVSNITYIAESQPGSELSASVWRCKKIEDLTSTVRITWADGNGNFDNAASSLNSLTYI